LTKLYADDPDFSQNIRSLAVLSFLPTSDIISTFEQLKQQFPAQGQPTINYFEETYVGIKNRLSRPHKQPKFELDLWNTRENTIQGRHRTNNIVEGRHSRLSALFNCKHPNFWKFLKNLKKNKEQSYANVELIQAEAGARQPMKKATTIRTYSKYFK
ncbi:unnamed protein product, partial [Didymodactylos carnosus]